MFACEKTNESDTNGCNKYVLLPVRTDRDGQRLHENGRLREKPGRRCAAGPADPYRERTVAGRRRGAEVRRRRPRCEPLHRQGVIHDRDQRQLRREEDPGSYKPRPGAAGTAEAEGKGRRQHRCLRRRCCIPAGEGPGRADQPGHDGRAQFRPVRRRREHPVAAARHAVRHQGRRRLRGARVYPGAGGRQGLRLHPRRHGRHARTRAWA